MTTLREAARQALEALENGNRVRAGEGGTKCQISLEGSAITALRAALAEPVQEPVQEPVAWRFKAMIGSPWSLSDDGYYISCKRDQRYFVEALYTAPPQRKPLAEWQINDLMADIDPEDVCSWSFRQGVYAAEKHHGVKP